MPRVFSHRWTVRTPRPKCEAISFQPVRRAAGGTPSGNGGREAAIVTWRGRPRIPEPWRGRKRPSRQHARALFLCLARHALVPAVPEDEGRPELGVVPGAEGVANLPFPFEP